MILAIDPGNIESAFVLLDEKLKPCEAKIVDNVDMLEIIEDYGSNEDIDLAIEMIASYGMAVGKTVFDTCVWIGRFYETAIQRDYRYIQYIYRQEEKMNLCHSMKANDSNITQALIDRFAPNTRNKGKGVKANPGWFYGFKKDIWQAYAVGVTYHDIYLKGSGLSEITC